MSLLQKLNSIRSKVGEPFTIGLSSVQIEQFCQNDHNLKFLENNLEEKFNTFLKKYSDLLKLPERQALVEVQKDFLNFYSEDAVSTYLPLIAKGPWIISAYGALIYDSGGYGMLGLGHNPDGIEQILAKPQIMANIMTPNVAQIEFTKKLQQNIGQNGICPYSKFVCLNSGSEANSVAATIVDAHTKILTDPGSKHAGKKIKALALKQSFHGRTVKPALFSDSSYKAYREYLASYRESDYLDVIEVNNLEQLNNIFKKAKDENYFYEVLVMEPVMGEGDPGESITPEFYKLARELIEGHEGLMLIDSIQAGLRAHGTLSICDYPGFENCKAPDFESFSKSLNAGQFPLSVLALSKKAANIYKKGLYGNTMTTNPRALEVAIYVIDHINQDIKENINKMGKELLEALKSLCNKYPQALVDAKGCGLLASVAINSNIKAYGRNSLEEAMRVSGINVIHGGANALRFTPHFKINSAEVNLITNILEANLLKFI